MKEICFVTGASGFVGRHLLPRLAARYRIRALVRPGQRLAGDVEFEPIAGRLDDEPALARGVEGADIVVHLAALVSFRREDHAAMRRANVEATARLAALAHGASVRRFLHCSTISAVAYRDRPEVVDETAEYNFGPLGIGYCDTKRAAEEAVLAEVSRGLDAVIVNPPSMFGSGDPRKGGDGSLITAVIRGELKFAPPGGLNVANVDDVCAGMLAALDRGRAGERYLLGGENLTGRQLVERIAAVAGGTAPKRTFPRWLTRLAARVVALKERVTGSKLPLTSQILRLAPRYLWYSSAKAERELGWRAGSVDPGIVAAAGDLADG
ncbi:MAG: NAD-dependent epimerase/dehydratase family protein [bacterium]|nr:NAD-dependent epimerase/dehydratase family protein [bacterium]